MPAICPLTVYRGDTYRWRFTLWTDCAHTVSVDLTGATVLAQIRQRPGGMLLAELACIVTLPNIIDATLAAEDCAKLTSSGAWDLQVTYPNGDVATVLAGPVTVTVDVSVPETTP